MKSFLITIVILFITGITVWNMTHKVVQAECVQEAGYIIEADVLNSVQAGDTIKISNLTYIVL